VGLLELFGIGDVSGQVQASRAQLDRIEAKLDLILDHLEVEYVPAGVIALLKDGKWKEAVKAYRQSTGVGRREAEDAVEALAARIGAEDS
jgi:ribosomal protein L7/L12